MHSYVSPTSGFKYTLSQLPADFSAVVKSCNALGGHLAAYADIAEQQVSLWPVGLVNKSHSRR